MHNSSFFNLGIFGPIPHGTPCNASQTNSSDACDITPSAAVLITCLGMGVALFCLYLAYHRFCKTTNTPPVPPPHNIGDPDAPDEWSQEHDGLSSNHSSAGSPSEIEQDASLLNNYGSTGIHII